VATICKRLGAHFYHQGDPRGCALYVSAEPIKDNDYTRASRAAPNQRLLVSGRRARTLGRDAYLLRQRAAAVERPPVRGRWTSHCKLIGKPRPDGLMHTPYSAAKAAGIALSTIYRAIKRLKQA